MICTPQKTVGEIAAETPAAVRVFEKYGIDFCCGGKRPLDDACHGLDVSAETLMEEIEATSREKTADGTDWSKRDLGSLIDYIVDKHHEYLRAELPLLGARVAKIADNHASKYPHMVQLRVVFDGLKDELDGHLKKEEMILFSFIKDIENAAAEGRKCYAPFGTVDNPIRMMMYEHDNAGNALAEMRRLTLGYSVPEDACNTLRASYYELQRLEADLQVHIHLENNILFPRAQALEAAAR